MSSIYLDHCVCSFNHFSFSTGFICTSDSELDFVLDYNLTWRFITLLWYLKKKKKSNLLEL